MDYKWNNSAMHSNERREGLEFPGDKTKWYIKQPGPLSILAMEGLLWQRIKVQCEFGQKWNS